MVIIDIDNIQLKATISSTNIHIENSYLITNQTMMEAAIEKATKFATNLGYTFSRSRSSWIDEWKAHNLLYFIGVAKKRTGSVDLNEDESIWRRVLYKLLSMCYNILFKN